MHAMRTTGRFGLVLATALGVLAGSGLGCPAEAQAQIIIQPPRVYIGPPRVRVRWWRPRVWLAPPPVVVAPPPVYMAPPPVIVAPPPVYETPPPVYSAPPPPPYTPPPPVYAPPPPLALPPPVSVAPPPALPQWRARFGLGARFAGLVNSDGNDRFSQLGWGGEVLVRASRHISLEMAGEYQRRIDEGLARYDVPVTFGMRVHIGAPDWIVSPYFVFATGLDYANLDFLHAHDIAWFAEGQAGGGLEVRLGQHFAINADIRGDGRLRMNQPTDAAVATVAVDGKPFHPMGNQGGAQFRLGAAVYF